MSRLLIILTHLIYFLWCNEYMWCLKKCSIFVIVFTCLFYVLQYWKYLSNCFEKMRIYLIDYEELLFYLFPCDTYFFFLFLKFTLFQKYLQVLFKPFSHLWSRLRSRCRHKHSVKLCEVTEARVKYEASSETRILKNFGILLHFMPQNWPYFTLASWCL